MSTSINPPLSNGVQDLYNAGLLPSTVGLQVLNGASGATSLQVTKLASSTLALQEAAALFSPSTSTTSDTATLSTTANDALNQAVSNELTAAGNAAASKFLPAATPASTPISVLA